METNSGFVGRASLFPFPHGNHQLFAKESTQQSIAILDRVWKSVTSGRVMQWQHSTLPFFLCVSLWLTRSLARSADPFCFYGSVAWRFCCFDLSVSSCKYKPRMYAKSSLAFWLEVAILIFPSGLHQGSGSLAYQEPRGWQSSWTWRSSRTWFERIGLLRTGFRPQVQ